MAYSIGYTIGFMIGALIPTFIISRIFIWVLKKLPTMSPLNYCLLGNILSWLISTILYGMGTSGEERELYGQFISKGLSLYIIPQTVWLVVDLYRINKKTIDKT